MCKEAVTLFEDTEYYITHDSLVLEIWTRDFQNGNQSSNSSTVTFHDDRDDW